MPEKVPLISHLKSKDWLVLSVLWAILIAVLSCIPGTEIPKSKLLEFDKLGHFLVYAILAFFLGAYQNTQSSRKKPVLKVYIMPFLIGSVLGAFLEYAQGNWLTGRYFDLLDVIANIIGCIAGVILAALLLKTQEV